MGWMRSQEFFIEENVGSIIRALIGEPFLFIHFNHFFKENCANRKLQKSGLGLL
jgi:hypothetical protein